MASSSKRDAPMNTPETRPTANNHIEPCTDDDALPVLPVFPKIPLGDEVVDATSGMIKPPKRPDD